MIACACVQRCARAEVRVSGEVIGSIGRGLLVLLGVEKGDGDKTAEALAERLATLRIFEDEAGKMNRACPEVGGAFLVVSQFTLAASTDKGRRPSFDGAAPPEVARELYERVVEHLRTKGLHVQTGAFGARMEVDLVNDGPVTFLLKG